LDSRKRKWERGKREEGRGKRKEEAENVDSNILQK
jgi:hypothetical protein